MVEIYVILINQLCLICDISEDSLLHSWLTFLLAYPGFLISTFTVPLYFRPHLMWKSRWGKCLATIHSFTVPYCRFLSWGKHFVLFFFVFFYNWRKYSNVAVKIWPGSRTGPKQWHQGHPFIVLTSFLASHGPSQMLICCTKVRCQLSLIKPVSTVVSLHKHNSVEAVYILALKEAKDCGCCLSHWHFW